MKLTNYLKAQKAIENKRAELKPVSREYDFTNELRTLYTNASERDEIREKIKAMQAERDEIRNANNFKMHELKILENNRRIALYNDVLPVIVETLNKYNGKKYGEKTADKIRQELKTIINCSVWLHERTITINLLDKNGFNCGVQIEIHSINYDTKIINSENVICGLSAEQLTHYYGDTITNTKKHVTAILKAYENAKKERENYYKAVSSYNALVSRIDIKNLDYPQNVNHIFFDVYNGL